MLRQQLCRTLLIVPRKPSGTVGCELDVVWWIRVDKVSCFNAHRLDVDIRELPLVESLRVLRKIGSVVDRAVRAEGDIEPAALVETAKTVEARAVQIIEQLRRLTAFCAAVLNQLIEALAMPVEELLVVAHLDPRLHAVLQVPVKVDEMRVDVVEQRPRRLQAKHDREPAAKRFNVAAIGIAVPDRFDMRHQPAFATGPL